MKEGLGTPTIVEFVTDPQLLGLNLSPALVEEVIAASGGLAIQRASLTPCRDASSRPVCGFCAGRLRLLGEGGAGRNPGATSRP